MSRLRRGKEGDEMIFSLVAVVICLSAILVWFYTFRNSLFASSTDKLLFFVMFIMAVLGSLINFGVLSLNLHSYYNCGQPVSEKHLAYQTGAVYETVWQEPDAEEFVALLRESDGDYRLFSVKQAVPSGKFIVAEVNGEIKFLPCNEAETAETPANVPEKSEKDK